MTEEIFHRAASRTALHELMKIAEHWQRKAVLLLAVLKVIPPDLMLEELLSGLESPKAHWKPLKDFLQSIPGRVS